MIAESNPTWDELVAHEPVLNSVLLWARTIRSTGRASWADYEKAKSMLAPIIGSGRPGPESFLSSSTSYEVAIRTVVDALGL